MDDIVSIESVKSLDQLSFWCLTISTMLKFIAMGVTIAVMPFNEWIQLKRSGTQMTVFRGISGSDCIFERDDAAIQCSRWEDSTENRAAFWGKFGLNSLQVDEPGGSSDKEEEVFRSLFYLVLLQLFLFLLDIGATLVMCCRYKMQKDEETLEKRVSLALSGTILFFYALIALSALSANFDFTNSRPPFHSCMGAAFKLYCGMFCLFGLGCFLSHFSRLMVLRQECKERGGGGGNRGRGRTDEEVQLR